MNNTVTAPKFSVSCRKADFDDCKGLNHMVETSGGMSIYKAAFGQFNFPSIVETCFLTLVVTEGVVNVDSTVDENYVAMMSINDCISITGDCNSFSNCINELKQYIPVTVSVISLFVYIKYMLSQSHFIF